MATCHALARAGHDVHLIVRPDTAPSPRDPFAFYGLPRVERLYVTPVATPGSAWLRRITFLGRAWRLTRRHRDAVVFTRDLGLASLLVRRADRPPAAARLRVPRHCTGRRRRDAGVARQSVTVSIAGELGDWIAVNGDSCGSAPEPT